MSFRKMLFSAILTGLVALNAVVYLVGPEQQHQNLQAVAALLNPGDTVMVEGNHSYPGDIIFSRSGTSEAKIVIQGKRLNNQRPVLTGGVNTVHFKTADGYNSNSPGAHHYVLEGFEIKGGSERGIFHQAKDLTIRDCYIHHCPKHGILGADAGSGSLLLEYSEVAYCGSGDNKHQIYMSTDQERNPGSVFRMQHCYIHDATGGNNVKSRAERNEIYYNWIEGAFYHELELIGSQEAPAALKREDSDVVGNVIIKKQTTAGNDPNGYLTRIGGDGTGATSGRYRFVNNSFISGSRAVFRMYDNLESVEITNNVFYSAGTVTLARTTEAVWSAGVPIISGQNNWLKEGAQNIPPQFSGTISGNNPGFINLTANNFHPLSGSPLINAGVLPSASAPGHEFPNPLAQPLKLPPEAQAELPGTARNRVVDSTVDIGAFEFINPSGIKEDKHNDFKLNASPNPFNPVTHLTYELPISGLVQLDLYNVRGELVRNLLQETQSTGKKQLMLDGSLLNSGIYFCRLQGVGINVTSKIVVCK